jgi:hypothetical protein
MNHRFVSWVVTLRDECMIFGDYGYSPLSKSPLEEVHVARFSATVLLQARGNRYWTFISPDD